MFTEETRLKNVLNRLEKVPKMVNRKHVGNKMADKYLFHWRYCFGTGSCRCRQVLRNPAKSRVLRDVQSGQNRKKLGH